MQNSRYSALTDEEIVTLAQAGNAVAEEFLIKKYKALVKQKSNAYFIVGGDKEDVIQEGMIGIFKAIRGYDASEEASFRTFADICINRQIISAIRTANLQKYQILNESLSLSRETVSEDESKKLEEQLSSNNDDDPETLMLMKEIGEFLKEDSHELFSSFEKRVWDRILQGKTYLEIADELGKSNKAVDNATQRIKKKIYAYLGY